MSHDVGVGGGFVALRIPPQVTPPCGTDAAAAAEHPAVPVRPDRIDDTVLRTVSDVLAELLGRPVDPATSFFAQDATSLDLVRAHRRLRRLGAGDLAVVDLFEHPTVSALAARLSVNRTVLNGDSPDDTRGGGASDARVSAIVATAVLHHFDADGRRFLLALLAERLAPGAPAFVEVQEPAEPCSVPPTRYHTAPAGEFVHEGWMQAEPASPATMRWTMTYRTYRGPDLVDERRTAFTMHPVSPAQLAKEAAEAGFAPRELDCGLMELRRRFGEPRRRTGR